MRKKSRLLIQSFNNAVRAWGNLGIVLPLLVYGGVQFLVLAGLIVSSIPGMPFSAFIAFFYGESFLHYPQNYLVLPAAFNAVNTVLSGFAGTIVVGLVTRRFYSKHVNPGSESGIKHILPCYHHLFIVWLLQIGTLVFLNVIYLWLIEDRTPDPVFAIPARFGVNIFISAVFAFSTIFIVIEKKKWWSALQLSFKRFLKFAPSTIVIVGIPVVLQYPFEFVFTHSDRIIERLNPEMIAVLVSLGIVFSIFLNSLTIGTLTGMYIGPVKKKETSGTEK